MTPSWVRNRRAELTLAAVSCCLLVSCAGIARGITEGLVGSDHDEEDTRSCSIQGPGIRGVTPLLEAQDDAPAGRPDEASRKTTKLLMVHGIGRHAPGYSTRFAENLTRVLGLTVTERTVKEIGLRHREFPDEDLGHLAVRRFSDRQDTRELLFYELTWSAITEEEKKSIEYDNSGEQSFRRANVNHTMKVFLNTHISDPMVYLGSARKKIVTSILQAMCWMTYGDWEDLDATAQRACTLAKSAEYTRQLAEDEYAIVTHSLGSRIVVDAYQAALALIHAPWTKSVLAGEGPLGEEEIGNVFAYLAEYQKKDLQLFMLANQLPLLQLGREAPPVTGKLERYCAADAPQSEQRLFRRLSIVAFSDPNDLLSYPIPPKYADTSMDSRMCPRITNVVLNVARVTDFFGVGQLANPLEAHAGYDDDARVIALIAHGISRTNVDPLVSERCEWLEIMEDY